MMYTILKIKVETLAAYENVIVNCFYCGGTSIVHTSILTNRTGIDNYRYNGGKRFC